VLRIAISGQDYALIILETDMHDIRQVVEERVLKWPVGAKKMMFWLSRVGIVEKPTLQ